MKKDKIFKLTITAMFTAIIFLFTQILIPAPTGFLHFADSIMYLCAGLVGGPWAIFAGVIGETLADVTSGYLVYAPFTIVIKFLVCGIMVLASRKSNKILTWKSAVATIPAGLITVFGYSIADYIINKAQALATLPINALQAVSSAVIFIILAAALDKAKLKSKIISKYDSKRKNEID